MPVFAGIGRGYWWSSLCLSGSIWHPSLLNSNPQNNTFSAWGVLFFQLTVNPWFSHALSIWVLYRIISSLVSAYVRLSSMYTHSQVSGFAIGWNSVLNSSSGWIESNIHATQADHISGACFNPNRMMFHPQVLPVASNVVYFVDSSVIGTVWKVSLRSNCPYCFAMAHSNIFSMFLIFYG